jgi:hypothetical protein
MYKRGKLTAAGGKHRANGSTELCGSFQRAFTQCAPFRWLLWRVRPPLLRFKLGAVAASAGPDVGS